MTDLPIPPPDSAQLLRLAEIVLEREVMAAVAVTTTPAEYLDGHADRLRMLWKRSAPLRAAVGVRGQRRRTVPADGSPSTGESKPAVSGKDRAVQRLEQRVEDLRKRERRHRGRADSALAEAAALRVRLAETTAQLAEAQEDAVTVARDRDSLSRRSRDPVAAMLLLFRELRTDVPGVNADPRKVVDGPRERVANPALQAALERACVEPARLRAVLREILVPARPTPGPTVSADATTRGSLRVVPVGGENEIGGSCLLIDSGGTRVLVDAGTRHGDRVDQLTPSRFDEVFADGPPPEALVISHAHGDHCGYAPVLAARWPHLRIISTPPTAELLPTAWEDARRLHAARRAERQGWGDTGADPLFGRSALEAACARLEVLPFGVPCAVGDVYLELFPAGHILGSAGVVASSQGRRVVVSGDVCTEARATAEPLAIPLSAREADLLVLETTCCTAQHAPRAQVAADLVAAVRETCDGGGRVLVPATAVGRAQEVAAVVAQALPDVPVLIDGLARNVWKTYCSSGAVEPNIQETVRVVGDRAMELRTLRSGVVVSTSGTLRGGPAVAWAQEILPDPAGLILLSGYQDGTAPGRDLLGLSSRGMFDLPGGPVPVRAAVRMAPLGAHADNRGLLSVVDDVRPQAVALVHGHAGKQERFRSVLRARGDRPLPSGPWRVG